MTALGALGLLAVSILFALVLCGLLALLGYALHESHGRRLSVRAARAEHRAWSARRRELRDALENRRVR